MKTTRRNALGGLGAAATSVALSCRRADRRAPATSGADEAESKRPPPPAVEPRLLVGRRGPELRRRAEARDPAFMALRRHVEARGDEIRGGVGAENAAVLHVCTGGAPSAQIALGEARRAMREDFRRGSYLYINDIVRPVAMALDLCADAIAPADAEELADFVAETVHELWFDNRGSGWGLDDPANNYHMAFIEATAFAGLALDARDDPRAKKLLAKLYECLDSKEGVVHYLNHGARGGDWHEGANYGQRSKQRLYAALLAIRSMGGDDYFERSPFFADSIRFAMYQLQPDRTTLHPSGDLARSSDMQISPYDRDVVQLAVFGVDDEDARALGRYYLEHLAPHYVGDAFAVRDFLYKEFIFATEGPTRSPDTLSTHYLAAGTGFATIRTDWSQDATCLTVSAPDEVTQSHAHFDVGSFTLFKGAWLALDAASLSRSGLSWEAGAHNLVHVEGHQRRPAHTEGLQRWTVRDGLAFAAVDASGLYRRRGDDGETRDLIDVYTRDLVFSVEEDVLVVFDRVEAPADRTVVVRTHVASRPERDGSLWRVSHDGGHLAIAVPLGGRAVVAQDTDLQQGPSEAYRLEIAPAERPARFLTVLRASAAGPPALDVHSVSEGSIVGVVVGGSAFLFSCHPQGRWPDEVKLRVPAEVGVEHLVLARSDRAFERSERPLPDGRLEIALRAQDGGEPTDGIAILST